MNESENLLDIKGLAAMLTVSTRTAYKYAREGSIPVLRIGRTYRFSRQAVLDQMAAPRDLWAYTPRSKAGRRK